MQGLPKNPYTTGPFGSDLLAQVTVSPEVVWVGAGTWFLHPEKGRVRQEGCVYLGYRVST